MLLGYSLLKSLSTVCSKKFLDNRDERRLLSAVCIGDVPQ